MNFLHTFWSNLKNSFYNPSFYAGVKQWTLGRAVFFILMMCFVYELIIAVPIAVVSVPAVLMFSPQELIDKHYPEGLEVVIEKGIASANVPQPYIIPVPKNPDAKPGDVEDFANLLVIETTRDVSVSEIESFDSLAILTKDSIIMKESKEKTQIVPLKGMDFTVNKENIEKGVATIEPIVKTLVFPLAVIVLLVIAPFMLLGYMITALIWGLLAWAISWARNNPHTYKQIYKVSLVAQAPIITLSIIVVALGIPLPPFTDFVIFLALVWLNLQPVDATPDDVVKVNDEPAQSEEEEVVVVKEEQPLP